MPSMDIFNDDAFSLVSLSARANAADYTPSQLGDLGIFESDGITTTTAAIEYTEGRIALIEPTLRGGAGESTGDDDRKIVPFEVPHIQRDDAVLADEVQNIRAFGSEAEVETVLSRVDRKVAKHLRDLDVTLEHTRVGAIKGLVLSKKGRTITDTWTKFAVAEPAAFVMGLDSDATQLRGKCLDLISAQEDALDEAYTGAHALCGRDFWRALIEHKAVRETYLNTQQAAELRGAVADSFEFGGVTWHRYRTGAKATAANAGAPFIAATEARFVFAGVPGLFLTRFAPADYEETVNTLGLPRYVKQYAMRNGKGRHLEVQSNPLSICTKPSTLRRLVVA